MKLSDESKIKILSMGGKELYSYLQERDDLSLQHKKEIYEFWCQQHEIKLPKRK